MALRKRGSRRLDLNVEAEVAAAAPPQVIKESTPIQQLEPDYAMHEDDYPDY